MSDTTAFPPSETATDAKQARKNGSLTPGSWFLLGAIVIVAAVFGLALYQRQQAVQPTGGTAPKFTLETFDNQKISLESLQGKVVVINFWASWCGPCRDEAPELEAAWQKYQDTGKVVFMGVAYADNGPRSIEFLNEFSITYLNGPDLGTRISESYHISGVPETFIIDQAGSVVRFIYAGVTEKMLGETIDALLAKDLSS